VTATRPPSAASPVSPSALPSQGKTRRTRVPSWVELPLLIVLTLAIAALIRTFLVQPFFIPSESMQDTLQIGDRVLVDKVSYRLHDIKRGDVVVFNGLDSFTPEVQVDEPGNAFGRALHSVGAAIGVAPPGEKDFIKRVIGVPGDRVVCCDGKGRITVNGQPLDESAYLFPGDKPSESPFDVIVPPERLWVMGDHRSASADSRAHTGDPGGGTVPENKVIGRAFSIVWPLGRLTGLGVPATFDRVGSPRSLGEQLSPYALASGVTSPCVVGQIPCRSGTARGTEGLTR
jgi:signal peptidase I